MVSHVNSIENSCQMASLSRTNLQLVLELAVVEYLVVLRLDSASVVAEAVAL